MPVPSGFSAADERSRKRIAAAIVAEGREGAREPWAIATFAVRKRKAKEAAKRRAKTRSIAEARRKRKAG